MRERRIARATIAPVMALSDRASVLAALMLAACGGRTTSDGSGSGPGGSSSTSSGVGGSGVGGTGGVLDASPCQVGCPDIGCAPGYVPVLEPGACCPVCQPDPANSCRQGQKAYAEFHAMIFEKYESVGCKMQMDCTVVIEKNRCVSGCGTVVPAQLARDFEDNLSAFADSSCSTCGPIPVPPCPAPLFPDCLGGTCAPGGTPPP
jgi:hypothetical protein